MKTSFSSETRELRCLFFFCSLAFFAVGGFAQPANDLCLDFTFITYGSTTVGTTVDATYETEPICPEVNVSKDVWYAFTGDGGTARLVLAAYKPKLSVYTGTCSNLVCVKGIEGNNKMAMLGIQTQAGVLYRIRVRVGGPEGPFTLFLSDSPVSNDLCSNAFPINNGLRLGTLLDAYPDVVPGCEVDGNRGIWYSFVGNGETATIKQTSSFPRLSVYQGTCSDLVCVVGNEENFNLPSAETQVEFTTTPGTNYFIFVQQIQELGGFLLEFNLPPPSNDAFSNATPLGCGETLAGATINALTTQPNPATCGGIAANTRDVWYKFNGNGQNMTISTCSGPNFNTQVSVYTPTPTGLLCVGGNDDFCGLRSQVTVATSAHFPYLVRVAGANNAQGAFEITRSCTAPANNNCESSSLLLPNQLTGGSVEAASVQTPFPPNCASTDGTASDVWYHFIGNGTNATVSLCGTTASFDAQLSAFTGSCGNLNCVAANDNTCGNRPQITFPTGYGVFYRVRVNGKNNAQGSFGIKVTFSAPANDACANAALVSCDSSTDGTTVGATAETTPECGVPLTTSPGVWYRFVGNGTTTTVSTCNLFNNNFDTKIRVFTGSCTSLACVAGNDNGLHCGGQSRVSFQTTAGTTYRILVNGALNESGNFTLSVNCGTPLNGGSGALALFPEGDEATEQLPGAPLSFSLSPNPVVSGEVRLAMPPLPEAQEASLEIHNLLGQPVLRRSLGRVDVLDEQIDLSSLANGLYIATLRAGNERATQRLIVGAK